MEKNIFYAGVIVLVVALLLLIASLSIQSNYASGLAQNITSQNITVTPMNYGTFTAYLQNSSVVLGLAQLSSKANIYFLNQSAYTSWHTYASANTPSAHGLNFVKSLEGKGALMIYNNVTGATLPQLSNESGYKPIYVNDTGTALSPGKYYIVIDNTNGSYSSNTEVGAHIVFIEALGSEAFSGNPSQLFSVLGEGTIIGIAFFFTFVAGIVITIWGYLKKSKEQEEKAPKPFGWALKKQEPEDMKTYVDKLYKNLDRPSRRKTQKRKLK